MRHVDYLDTLRGHSREEIAAALTAAHAPSTPTSTIDSPPPDQHFDCAKSAVARIDVQQPGGSTAHFLVRLTEISKHGLGFLHGGYLHAGSRCKVTVMTPKGAHMTIPGVVHHGRCIRGRIHCFEVQFESPNEADPRLPRALA